MLRSDDLQSRILKAFADDETQGACHGDSGGPLMKISPTFPTYEIVGVSSYIDSLFGQDRCFGYLTCTKARLYILG